MPRVTDEHRAARRQQIVLAAARCVAREGFHKTTMADVIAEAGLSAGAVYGYYRSKTEIIRAIADLAVGEAAHVIGELAVREETVTPSDVLTCFVERIDAVVAETGIDLPRVGVQTWAEAVRDPEVHALAKERMGALRSSVEEVLRRCQADGTLAVDADPHRAAQALFGMLPGFVLQRLVLEDVTAESYAQGFADLTR
jgi:AcrR family transcriptional regulator